MLIACGEETRRGRSALDAGQTQARQDAEVIRQNCAAELQLAESGYVSHMLLAAQHASDYVQARLLLGDNRAAIISSLEGDLNRYSSTRVVVNRLIAVHWARTLLCEGMDAEAVKLVNAVPVGHWNNAFCALVQRRSKGSANEHYVLLPGVEQAARNFFQHALANNLSRKACADKVREFKAQATGRPLKERTTREAGKPAPPPPGVNLIPNKDASPKDVAEFAAQCVLGNSDPDLVFVELLGQFIHGPTQAPVGAFRSDAVQDAILRAVWAIQDAAASSGAQDRRDHFRRR